MAHLLPTTTVDLRVVERQPKETLATAHVEKLIMQIKNARTDIKDLQFQEGQLKKELDAEIGNTETVLDKKGHVLATWAYNDTHRFDMDRFKEDHPEMYEHYLKTSRERRLSIKK